MKSYHLKGFLYYAVKICRCTIFLLAFFTLINFVYELFTKNVMYVSCHKKLFPQTNFIWKTVFLAVYPTIKKNEPWKNHVCRITHATSATHYCVPWGTQCSESAISDVNISGLKTWTSITITRKYPLRGYILRGSEYISFEILPIWSYLESTCWAD